MKFDVYTLRKKNDKFWEKLGNIFNISYLWSNAKF